MDPLSLSLFGGVAFWGATTLVVLVCGLFVTQAFGTAQAPDKIWYEGKLYDMQTNPLEPYFAKNPGKKPKTNSMTTSLSRGYIATFEFSNGGLYLRDIEMTILSTSQIYRFQSVLSEVVPDGQRLKIDWFNGLLVLPHGKPVSYVHMGYGSTFENYVLIEIAAGEFKQARTFNNKEYEAFKDRQFAEFKKTDDYKKLVNDMKKQDANWEQPRMDTFIRNGVTSYTTRIMVD